MGRTTKDPDERREEFFNTALRLFQERGYDNVAVQHVTEAMGVAKGTFYHYFESKDALLAQLTEREVLRLNDVAGRAAGTAERPAMERLCDAFGAYQTWKLDNFELLLAYMRVLFRDENAVWREHMTGALLDTILPLLVDIMQDGMEEGVFAVDDAEVAAEVTTAIWRGMYDKTVRLILELEEHPELLPAVMRRLSATELAVERFLGIAPGELRLYDREAIEAALRSVATRGEGP